MSKYSVIIPAYNEEDVIEESYRRLTSVMANSGGSYELIFVNDGSRDKTEEILKSIAKDDNNVKLINFSRNFGHQVAISAGLDYATGDAVAVIDADLQDPPEVILEMIKKWHEGYDVIYGKRIKRHGETAFKKLTAKLFYRFLHSMTDVDIPVDAGDFRLMDKKVCDAMRSLSEKNRYVRGLVSWVGFKQTAVEYVREERFAGQTKYPLKKMIKFASDGVFSFSFKPLKFAQFLGFASAAGGFIYLIIALIQKFLGLTVHGWASLIATIIFFNGIILLVLGITGEYIGRIYDEVKGRPLYIVKDSVGFEKNTK